jgi:hypothetical protein
MRDPKWIALTDTQRGQLVAIWLLAADRNGSIPSEPDLIKRLCFIDGKLDLEVFVSLGFIERRHDDAKPATNGRQPDAPEERRGETEERQNTPVGVDALWGVWIEELGGNRPYPKLTATRSKKLRVLATEHLTETDPLAQFRAILKAVKASEHHMSKREYQMPESLFRNEDRRDTWVNKAAAGNGQAKRGSVIVRPDGTRMVL